MTAHDPRVTLTEAERRSLVEPFQRWLMDPEAVELSGVMSRSVEQIIAARLAPIRALAEQWNDTPDYMPSEYDRGRVDQRHDMTGQLYEALDAPVSASQDHDGAEGQDQGCETCRGEVWCPICEDRREAEPGRRATPRRLPQRRREPPMTTESNEKDRIVLCEKHRKGLSCMLPEGHVEHEGTDHEDRYGNRWTGGPQSEKDRNRITLADLAVQPRDEVIAQVMAFLLERGYSITAPDGRPIFPPGVEGRSDPAGGDGYVPGAWDEVRSAYLDGHISAAAYDALRALVFPPGVTSDE